MTEKDYILGQNQFDFIGQQRDKDGNLILPSNSGLVLITIPHWDNISALVQASIDAVMIANNWTAIN